MHFWVGKPRQVCGINFSMKKAIFQYHMGPKPEWVGISQQKFKKYAEVTGADYFFFEKYEFCNNHYFEKLKMIYLDTFKYYDRVLYVDTDVIVENFIENIFDIEIEDAALVPEHRANGMKVEPLFMKPEYVNTWELITKVYNIPFIQPQTVKAEYLMFNSGVMLWSREGLNKAKEKFLPCTEWIKNVDHFSLDQPYFNGQIIKHLNYKELPLKWNCFPRMRFNEGFIPEEINFVHYTGGKKQYIKELYT